MIAARIAHPRLLKLVRTAREWNGLVLL